jgi:hypothetical protein
MKTHSRKFVPVRYIFIGIVALFAVTALFFVLWNWLVPAIFNGPVITFWQSLGILVLSKILFSGVWKHKSHYSGYPHSEWRKRFEEKMKNMSDEEKERFKAKFRHRPYWFEPMDDEKREDKEDSE